MSLGAGSAIDAYPSKPVRYVVPFGDGPTATQAHWLAGRLGPVLGQPVVVETHPGASGVNGTALVAGAAPDGYTLLAANPGPLTVAPNLRRNVGYDSLRDFSPIVLMATVASVIAVHAGVPARDINELLALARAHPGGLRYGSPGVGTVGHLALELFQHLGGIRMTHLPREGLSEAIPEYFVGRGYDITGGTPEAFGAFLRSEREKWGKVVRLAGIETN